MNARTDYLLGDEDYKRIEPMDADEANYIFPDLLRKIMDDFFKGTDIKGRTSQYDYIGQSIGISSAYVKKLINMSFVITNVDVFFAICFVLRLSKKQTIELAKVYSEQNSNRRGFPLLLEMTGYEEMYGRLYEIVDLLDEFSKKTNYEKSDGKRILIDVSNELLKENLPPLDIPLIKKNNDKRCTDFQKKEIKRFIRIKQSFDECSNSLFYRNIPKYVLEAVIAYMDEDNNRFYVVSYADVYSFPYEIKHKWFKYDKQGILIDDYIIHGTQEVEVENENPCEDDYWPKITSQRLFGKDYNLEKNINIYKKYYFSTDEYLKSEIKKKLRIINDTLYFKERIGAKIDRGIIHIIYESYNYAYPEKKEYFFMDKYDDKYEFKVSKESIFMGELVHGTEYSEMSPKRDNEVLRVFGSMVELELFFSSKKDYYSLTIKEIINNMKSKVDEVEKQILDGTASIYESEEF